MNPTVVVWDLDGTLFESAEKYDRIIYGRAFGIPAEQVELGDYHGSTDLAIFKQTARLSGIAESQIAEMALRLPELTKFVFAEMRDEYLADCPQYPDARSVLKWFATRNEYIQTTLTGNIREKAEAKLQAHELDEFIDFGLGAFGSDSTVRKELPAFVLKRLRENGFSTTPQQCIIIGDTPGDIECARAGSFGVVAISHGPFTREELQRHKPDVVVDYLLEVPQVVERLR